ncbi:alpha/beta hydrolase [Elusimicrobiota bacterium]
MNMIIFKFWLLVRTPLFLLLILYAVILLYFTITQSRFIYFPSHEYAGVPTEIGLPYESISFRTEDKVRLSGWFIYAENSRGVVLFCHGNAGNISHRLASIMTFSSLGYDVFIFDYRGYGKSEGKPTERGTYLDVKAAYNYLVKKRQVFPEEIIVFGRSLGGVIAAWLVKEVEVKAIIIESAFTSIKDLGAQLYPFIPVRLLSRFDYNAKEYLRYVNCPLLIVHSRDDEIIPISHGKKLFEIANSPKQLLEISGSHNEGFLISESNYIEGLNRFIKDLS